MLIDPNQLMDTTTTGKRIVSLVPSLTEMLCDVGLEKQMVGRTKFCIHPQEVIKGITTIGGTKNPNIEKISGLNPDVIIANKEENRKEDIDLISQFCPVLLSDIQTIADIVTTLEEYKIYFPEISCDHLIDNLKNISFPKIDVPISVLYLIWKDPYMSIGRDTFIHHILEVLGFQNVCAEKLRYPEINQQEMEKLNPQLVLLSSEPFPFKENHIQEVKSILPHAKVALVDGEMFSWYGSRVLKMPLYFANLFLELGLVGK